MERYGTIFAFFAGSGDPAYKGAGLFSPGRGTRPARGQRERSAGRLASGGGNYGVAYHNKGL